MPQTHYEYSVFTKHGKQVIKDDIPIDIIPEITDEGQKALLKDDETGFGGMLSIRTVQWLVDNVKDLIKG